MKTFLVVGGILLLFVLGNSAIYFAGQATARSAEGEENAAAEAARGPLVAEPAAIELGDLKIRQSREFTVRLRNKGDQTIKLAEVTAGCSCTDVKAEAMELAPGAETTVRGRFKGKSREGPFRVALRVERDAKGSDPLSIPITGTIHSRFPLSAKEVILKPSLLEDRAGTATVTLTNDSDQSVTLTSPPLEKDGLEVRIAKTSLAPGDSTDITFTAAADRVMEEEIALAIGTGHPDESHVVVNLHLQPDAPVSVTPKAFRLGVIGREEFLKHEPFVLTLKSESRRGLKVIKVETPAFLRAEPVRESEPGAFEITLVPVAERLGIDLRGEVAVVCGVGDSGPVFSLRVPVSGLMWN